MHPEILPPSQKKLLPLIKNFHPDFYLVGGTALALQLGHRRSIDYDLFSIKPFDNLKIRRLIESKHTINRIMIETKTEFTLLIDNIQTTFYTYHYPTKHQVMFQNIITMPDPLTLGAMKAFTLGMRAKWKDYVDLYFIFKKHSLKQVVAKAEKIFGSQFDQKLFREQLVYYKDLNYSQPIEYLPTFAIKDDII
ncbi:nucleotidyl transferase AbiEii/AbiGii toxin family protein, partial [Patescibacteria group bacterium]|nr:nucleotidyl transferase AbiEii/AbiGii toxin family protein [Patescibacteria group bacterium]